MICSDIWHKYHEWYFKIVIRTTALSQSNCRNFSCSSIIARIHKKPLERCYPTQKMPLGECYSPNPSTLCEPHPQPLQIIVQSSIYLQIEHLSGRNEELRHELHNAREETAKSIMQLERKNAKVRGSLCNLWNKPVIIISNTRNRFSTHYAESETACQKPRCEISFKERFEYVEFYIP